jgi:hypothetical protein
MKDVFTRPDIKTQSNILIDGSGTEKSLSRGRPL